MTLRDLLFSTIEKLNSTILELGQLAPVPTFDKKHKAFRHAEAVKDAQLAAFLKCVRSVSMLNAVRVLLEGGFVLEIYALCRSIDEANEDVSFLLLPLESEDLPQRQRYLLEFYQEEFDVPGKPMESEQKRDRAPRKRIQSALSRVTVDEAAKEGVMRKAADVIHKLFSGFVHGPYVHIMEMYEDHQIGYRVQGFKGTPKIDECEESLINNVYRTILALRMVCRSLGLSNINSKLRTIQTAFIAQTGCIGTD